MARGVKLDIPGQWGFDAYSGIHVVGKSAVTFRRPPLEKLDLMGQRGAEISMPR
jgi:hypothetical protein